MDDKRVICTLVIARLGQTTHNRLVAGSNPAGPTPVTAGREYRHGDAGSGGLPQWPSKALVMIGLPLSSRRSR